MPALVDFYNTTILSEFYIFDALLLVLGRSSFRIFTATLNGRNDVCYFSDERLDLL
jgi:hypothetical protein